MLQYPFQYPSSLKRRESFRVNLTGCSATGNAKWWSGRSWVCGERPQGGRRDAPGPNARSNTKPCIAKTANLRPALGSQQKSPQSTYISTGSRLIAFGLSQLLLKLIFNFNRSLALRVISVKSRPAPVPDEVSIGRVGTWAPVRAHSPLPESPP